MTGKSIFNRGYETWMVRDANVSTDKTQHETGLTDIGFAFSEVLLTRDVLKRKLFVVM